MLRDAFDYKKASKVAERPSKGLLQTLCLLAMLREALHAPCMLHAECFMLHPPYSMLRAPSHVNWGFNKGRRAAQRVNPAERASARNLEPTSVRNVTYIMFFVIVASQFGAKKCPKRYVYSVFCDYGVSFSSQKVSETLRI